MDDDKTQHMQAEDSGQTVLLGRSLDFKVAAAALVAVVIFMSVLNRLLFPTGITLKGESLGQASDVRDRAGNRDVSFAGNRGDADANIAEVVFIRRNVQVKGYNELVWSNAQKGVFLADRDSLQTSRNSGATVELEDNSVIKIGPDSLIVFQGGTTDPFTPQRTNTIVMMEGTLGAQFASTKESPRHLEVALPNGLARFLPGDHDVAVAFNINVNPDLSSSVSVLSGSGVVTVGGHTATVDAEHGVTISINGEVLEQGRLPGRPAGIRPHNNAAYAYRALPPELAFSWHPVPLGDRYRFRVARDADMTDIVIDERLGASRFVYSGLQDGTYYWQVSAMSGFIEGPTAGPYRLRLTRDTRPPKLDLQPSELVDGQAAALVRGRTDPGAQVYVQGEAITNAGGSFEERVDLDPGTNLIVVEAVDRAGNVAYDSLIFNTNTITNGGGK